jgi:hypothetical protein
MLISQRKMMWREDTLSILVNCLELKRGIVTVDFGCGLSRLTLFVVSRG